MKTNHLSSREQDEYLLKERTPQMLHHLAECSECREAVARMEEGIGMFRGAVVAYSAQSLAGRPVDRAPERRRVPAGPLRWAFAALVPLLLLMAALLPFRQSTPKPIHTDSSVTDDALLDQVDQQLSVAVPASMESLTHLVSAGGSSSASKLVKANGRSESFAQSN